MQETFLFEALRTPIGRGDPSGALYEVKPVDLLATMLRHIAANKTLPTDAFDELIIGCVTSVDDQGFNLAKAALLQAEWPEAVSGLTVNRFASSGLEAVNLAAVKVMAGCGQLMLAGGVESQSRVPAGSEGGPLLHDPSLVNRSSYLPKGIAADLLATLEGYAREELDELAARSLERTLQGAEDAAGALVPIRDRNGLLLLGRDEALDRPMDPAALPDMPPAYAAQGAEGFDAMALRVYPQLERILHLHTLGNVAARADGAALQLIGTRQAGEALGLQPRARIRSLANACVDPTLMLTGAVPTSQTALQRAGMQAADVDLWYVLESFAAVSLHFHRTFGIEEARLNPSGGALATGHPLGASGTILLGDLLREMERQDAEVGLAATAGGGGMGVATIIERVN